MPGARKKWSVVTRHNVCGGADCSPPQTEACEVQCQVRRRVGATSLKPLGPPRVGVRARVRAAYMVGWLVGWLVACLLACLLMAGPCRWTASTPTGPTQHALRRSPATRPRSSARVWERHTVFPCASAAIRPKTDAFACGAATDEATLYIVSRTLVISLSLHFPCTPTTIHCLTIVRHRMTPSRRTRPEMSTARPSLCRQT